MQSGIGKEVRCLPVSLVVIVSEYSICLGPPKTIMWFKSVWITCLDKRAKFASGFGIASHASNIRWSKDDRYIIVTGGRDRTVLVWRVDELIDEQQKKKNSTESTKTSE